MVRCLKQQQCVGFDMCFLTESKATVGQSHCYIANVICQDLYSKTRMSHVEVFCGRNVGEATTQHAVNSAPTVVLQLHSFPPWEVLDGSLYSSRPWCLSFSSLACSGITKLDGT